MNKFFLIVYVALIVAVILFIFFNGRKPISFNGRKLKRSNNISSQNSAVHLVRKQIKKNLDRYNSDSYENAIEFLKQINKAQNKLNRYDHNVLFGENGESFPIKSYMGIYNMLKLRDERKSFISFYHDDGIGGRPYIMAADNKPAIRKNLENMHSECRKSGDLRAFDKPIRFMEDHSAKEQIITSDTPIGYVQLLHFHEFGETFALFWHANSARKYVVTSFDQIKELVNSWENGPYQHSLVSEMKRYDDYQYMVDSSYSLSEDEIEGRKKRVQQDFENARSFNPSDIEPKIEMTDDHCTIEWVECYNNYGLYRCKYQISRKDYTVSQISEQPILSVEPTFMY